MSKVQSHFRPGGLWTLDFATLDSSNCGIVQLAARRTLTPKMKVRLLLPQPPFSRNKFKFTNRYFDCHLSDSGIVIDEAMFIRFYSGEIDEDAHVPAGLFCAASQLSWTDGLPQYEFEALSEL